MSTIFTQLLNMSITAGWLILAVILLRIILTKAPKSFRMILWAFVGIRLICPISIESIFSLIPDSEPISFETVRLYVPVSGTEHTKIPESTDSILDQTVSQVPVNQPLPETSRKPTDLTTNRTPDMTSDIVSNVSDNAAITNSIDPAQLFFTYGTMIWLIGIVVMILYTFFSYYKTYRKVQVSLPLSESIRLCDRISTPFILGVLRPRVYLPADMDAKDMEYVIAHETAHLKRGDHLWKPLGFLLLTIYWFHPLVWVAYILFCKDIEFACDEIVIRKMGNEQKQPYSNALLNCSIHKRALAACPLAFGEGSVKERIKAVLSYRKPSKLIVVTGFAVCLVTAVCFLSNPKAESEKEVFDFSYADYLGDTKESFAESIGIDSAKLDTVNKTVTYQDKSFYNTLRFAAVEDQDILMSIDYEHNAAAIDESLIEFVQNLKQDLTEQYGEPSDHVSGKVGYNGESLSDPSVVLLRNLNSPEDLQHWMCMHESWLIESDVSEKTEAFQKYPYAYTEGMVEKLYLYAMTENDTAKILLTRTLEYDPYSANGYKEANPAETFDYSYANYFGNTLEELYENTWITEEDLTDHGMGFYEFDGSITRKEGNSEFTTTKETTYQDLDFLNFFVFDQETGVFNELNYGCGVEKAADELFSKLLLLKEDFTTLYGEPLTYSNAAELSLGNMTSMKDIANVGMAFENWVIEREDKPDLLLRYQIWCDGDRNVEINIRFTAREDVTSDSSSSSDDLPFDFINLIGERVDDSLEALEIQEDQLVKKPNDTYQIDATYHYKNTEFQKIIYNKYEYITGGAYTASVSDKGETLTELVSSLKALLTERYGEPSLPDSEEDKASRIGDTTDFSKYEDADFLEIWNDVPCVVSESAPVNLFDGTYSWYSIQKKHGSIKGIVRLVLQFRPNWDEVKVRLDYRIDMDQFNTPSWDNVNPLEAFDFSYKAYLGNTLIEFLDNSGLTEQIVSKPENFPEGYHLLDSLATYHDRDFYSLLYFGQNPEILNSLIYGYRADEVNDDFYDFAQSLFDDLVKVYGETYPESIGVGLNNNLSVKDSLISNKSYSTYWYIPDSTRTIDGINFPINEQLTFKINIVEEGTALVELSYGLRKDLTSHNDVPEELNPFTEAFDFSYKEYLGNSMEEFLQKSGLTEDDLISSEKVPPDFYMLDSFINYRDRRFYSVPAFTPSNEFASINYGYQTNVINEAFYDFVSQLHNDILAEYGDSETTRTGIKLNGGYSIETLPEKSKFYDYWYVPNTATYIDGKTFMGSEHPMNQQLHLTITLGYDGTATVWIQYTLGMAFNIDVPVKETKSFEEVFDFSDTQYFGKTLQEFCLNTGIDADSLKVSEFEETSYYFDTTVKYQDREFYPLLHFSGINRDLAGVAYAFKTETIDEELFSYIQMLRDDIIEIYGTPHTAQFAAPSNNFLSDKTSMEQMVEKGGSFADYWIIPYSDTKIEGYDRPLYQTFYLRVMLFADKKTAVVWLNHCLATNYNAPFQLTEAFDFYFTEHLGREIDKIRWDLNVFDSIITKDTDYRYSLTEPVRYKNIPFTNWWDTLSGEYLTGGGYVGAADRTKHDLPDMVTSIRNLMIEKFGEPVTEPNAANILGERTDYAEFENITDVAALHETWAVNYPISLTDMEMNNVLPAKWKHAQEQNGEVSGTMHMDVTFFPDSNEVMIEVWYSINL